MIKNNEYLTRNNQHRSFFPSFGVTYSLFNILMMGFTVPDHIHVRPMDDNG